MALRLADNVLWEEVGNETVVLKLDEGKSYRLNRTGGAVWKKIAAGGTRKDISNSLLQMGAAGESLNSDLDDFIDELKREGLLVNE